MALTRQAICKFTCRASYLWFKCLKRNRVSIRLRTVVYKVETRVKRSLIEHLAPPFFYICGVLTSRHQSMGDYNLAIQMPDDPTKRARLQWFPLLSLTTVFYDVIHLWYTYSHHTRYSELENIRWETRGYKEIRRPDRLEDREWFSRRLEGSGTRNATSCRVRTRIARSLHCDASRTPRLRLTRLSH